MTTETTTTEDSESGWTTEVQGFHLLVMSLEVFWSQPLPSSGVVSVGRSSKCQVEIEDAMASREHARIHIGSEGGVPVLTIEDVGSQNGTRVRDVVIKPGEPAAVLPGEAIMIGSTVLMVLQDRPTGGHRRIWSHAYFEARVEEECARAAKSRTAFAVARIRFKGVAPWTRVTPILARGVSAPHVFASYGPKDYEILLVDIEPNEADALIGKLIESSRATGLQAQGAVVWYPKDGRSGDALLAAANASLKTEAGHRSTREPLPSDPGGMQRVRAMATRVASSSINVLILGESGVGKDVLARLIHQLSPRAGKPFVALNCASVPDALLESELFGYDKGAFTNAATSRVGLFESANGGTVFLDEIGEMPVSMQAKLLQAIELREVRPVGAVRSRPIDVRFLSATNVDIESAVAKGAFRRDLMYRLNTLTLAVPPLRERRDEIEPLATTFVAQTCRDLGREEVAIAPSAMACLLGYRWPGNIRELRNAIERALVLCEGPVILPEHLPLEKMRDAPEELLPPDKAEKTDGADKTARSRPSASRSATSLPHLADPKEAAERQRVIDALEAHVWSQTRAAEALKISRRTLVSKLDRYGIPRPQKGRPDDRADRALDKLPPPEDGERTASVVTGSEAHAAASGGRLTGGKS